ncbi:hypothetical protein ACFOZ0_18595 [Streptomyces yaanensis]|uniref:Uncharacterized protein n=1 Tax=Streptomyces yaanensis TaxID=1142239 RepID=A0ABV7SFF5_9ACTN|nr:hypothetical protein [Streptomyces sp. CGMCC 4.7035]WNB98113.1 hypothetical protein Q2K21_08500 [Streptomyces sp. CGMCC 4.7035]
MESAEPLPEDVRPSDDDWRLCEEEDDESVESVESVELLDEDEELLDDDEEVGSVPLLLLPELVEPVLPLADVSASACIVPTRANTPAAAASVTAAAVAAVRRAPLRTAATAPVPCLPWLFPSEMTVTLCHALRSGTRLREVCEAPIRSRRTL